MKFLNENDINFLQFGVPGNKEPFVDIPEPIIRDALRAILDVNNHPILIHCNKGKVRSPHWLLLSLTILCSIEPAV